MQIKSVIRELENLAPLSLQENWDNSGLITGNPDTEVLGILICLDSTEDVIEEAIRKNCNLVIAHHPILFTGLKSLTGKNYTERVIIKAIKNDIAIYSIHTNLDKIAQGVNLEICNRIGLRDIQVLDPEQGHIRKLITTTTLKNAGEVRNALFAAGAGRIGKYSECSFNFSGTGTYRPGTTANPAVGEPGKLSEETEERIEVVYEPYRETEILKALRDSHEYEEIAYDIYQLANKHQEIGFGMVGTLPQGIETMAFLGKIKSIFGTGCIRHTALSKKNIQKVAVCGGSGSFLLGKAIRTGADIFITSDFKYHQFFDAEGKIIVADVGHFESEQFTIDMLGRYLSGIFINFAVRLTETKTNPVYYF